MSRNNLSIQDTRSAKNPFNLGTFSRTSLRYIKGKLGPKYEVISGGYGNGEYNHWFQINISSPAWIIAVRDGERSKYINLSFYDLNKTPIEGRGIFDADSVKVNNVNHSFYPYLNTVMGAQSDLANTLNRIRLDNGDERYFPLETGSYLLCVSSTRNEPIDYAVGLVVEFPPDFGLILLEDGDGSLLETESLFDFTNTVTILSPVIANYTIPALYNAFTLILCEIEDLVTVTVPQNSEWLIDNTDIPASFFFELEPGDPSYFDTIHDHSLTEWKEAWDLDHHPDEKFPNVFIPYTTQS